MNAWHRFNSLWKKYFMRRRTCRKKIHRSIFGRKHLTRVCIGIKCWKSKTNCGEKETSKKCPCNVSNNPCHAAGFPRMPHRSFSSTALELAPLVTLVSIHFYFPKTSNLSAVTLRRGWIQFGPYKEVRTRLDCQWNKPLLVNVMTYLYHK